MVFLVAFTSVVNAQDEYPRDLALQMRNKAKQFGLGKPELDPQNITPTGKGFYERYSGGNVYYNPTTKGIYVVYGDILSKWGELGWENGELGFPTSNEKDSDKAGWKRMSTFDKGIIYWNDGKLEVVKKKFILDGSRKPINEPYDTSKLISKFEIWINLPVEKNGHPPVSVEEFEGFITNKDIIIAAVKMDKNKVNQSSLQGTDYASLQLGSIKQAERKKPDDYGFIACNHLGYFTKEFVVEFNNLIERSSDYVFFVMINDKVKAKLEFNNFDNCSNYLSYSIANSLLLGSTGAYKLYTDECYKESKNYCPKQPPKINGKLIEFYLDRPIIDR